MLAFGILAQCNTLLIRIQRGAGVPRVRAYILSSLVIVVVFVAQLLIRVQRGVEIPQVSSTYSYILA